MATIPLARQQQVSIGVPRPTLTQPQAPGPDPLVAAGADVTQRASGLLDNLAKAETEQLNQLYKNSIAAELSQFETDSRARVLELESTGTGDKPFVTGVLDDFEERASGLGTAYSEELRNEIKVKLLPIREQVAAAALATQTRKTQEQVLSNADIFQNNLVNQVRFGVAGETAAMARVEEFLQTVPDNMRLGVGTKVREQVRVASINRAMEEDPAGFMQRARSGEFNDVDPTYVDRAYESAARTLVEQQERAERRQRDIRELATKDPLLAARESLVLQGNAAPTREQLYAEQERLGVPRWRTAAIEKDRALAYVGAIQATTNPDELAGLLVSLQAEAVEKGEDWDTLQRNVSDFAKQENLPNIAHVLEVMNPKTAANYDPRYRQAAFEVMRDPKAADAATKLLGEKDAKTVREDAAKAVANHIAAKARAGASPSELAQDLQFSVDSALVAAARARQINQPFDAKIVAPPESIARLRFDNRNAYHVPAALDATLSPQKMDQLRQQVLMQQGLELPASYPNRARAMTDLMRDSGWVNYEGVGVALKVRGEQLYANGKPVIKTWEELTRGEAETRVFGAPLNQGGTTVLTPPSSTGPRDNSLFPTNRSPGQIELLPPPNL